MDNCANFILLVYRLCFEDMSQWSQSLERLLSSKCKLINTLSQTHVLVTKLSKTMANCRSFFLPSLDGMKIFQAFLKSEFSDENIEFWVVCEEFKKIRNSFRMSSRAKKIFKRYIQAESPREVCSS